MKLKPPSLGRRVIAIAAGLAILSFGNWAAADPPSRVARLGYVSGEVSFSPAGENDWVLGTVNRPLTTGDRLWSENGARAEIEVGGAMIRMNALTSVAILNLDDRITQLQLTQGTLNVRVRRLRANETFEVGTPNLAFTLRQPGDYRITVDPDGNATTIIVRKGQGEAYGDGASYIIDAGQPYRFTGTGLREVRYGDAPRPDEFDRWAVERDARYDRSPSARYVSPDVIGYQDLDANGTWRVDATYGNVWMPSRVAAGWAPYRDGHWAWVDPWGWTWIDDAPWGFAVSHYGRWTNLQGSWGWVPGPVRTRAYYAPALVAFVGGDNFQLSISSGNVSGVAWFPLGPREVYRPSYQVSRGYFENVNRSNTVINTTVINNYYSNTNITNVVYANRRVPGAIVAVPTTAFVQSQPVSRAAVRVSREMVDTRPVAVAAQAAPTEKSVRGAASQVDKPPPRVFERPIIAHATPPQAHPGFAAQQQQLTAKPGRPLDDAERQNLKPGKAAPAQTVKIVEPPKEARPTLRPPGNRPGDASDKPRVKLDDREAAKAPEALPGPPVDAKPEPKGNRGVTDKGDRPSQATPPSPAAKAPEPRNKPEPPEKAEQRPQPATPRPMPAQRTAEPRENPVQAPLPAPAATPPRDSRPAPQRAKPEPASRQDEARPPATAPGPVPQQAQQAPKAPKAEPRGQDSSPDTGKPDDGKKGKADSRRDDENRKP